MMTFLTVEAHDLTPEFEEAIKREFGVTVYDKTGEPWAVVFQGEREKLRAMFTAHWAEEFSGECGGLEENSPLLTECAPESEATESSEREHCSKCGAILDEAQIGLCDDCQD